MDDRLIWDVKSLLRACGGVEPFRRACLALGLEVPTTSAVRQWQTRASAPSEALAVLFTVYRHVTGDSDVMRFVRRKTGATS